MLGPQPSSMLAVSSVAKVSWSPVAWKAWAARKPVKRIRSLGGTFQSSVGKDTDYLVVGANVGASKLTKAAKLGTKQLTEQEFLKLL